MVPRNFPEFQKKFRRYDFHKKLHLFVKNLGTFSTLLAKKNNLTKLMISMNANSIHGYIFPKQY